MKILAQFELSKILELRNGENIFRLVEETFSLVPNSYIVKKLDREFEEYVDSSCEDVSHLDKLKIVKKDIPFASDDSLSDFSAFLSQDIQNNANISVEVVLNLKKTPWPRKIEIPVEDFSKPLRVAMDEKMI